MRVGPFSVEPIELKVGDSFTLTTDDIIGDSGRGRVRNARSSVVPSTIRGRFVDPSTSHLTHIAVIWWRIGT
jgi:hypothetical protein